MPLAPAAADGDGDTDADVDAFQTRRVVLVKKTTRQVAVVVSISLVFSIRVVLGVTATKASAQSF